MKQTISLQLLSCALLLSVSCASAQHKAKINDKSHANSSTSSNYNVDEQTKLKNDEVLLEASRKIAIDAFAHEVAEIFAKNAQKAVDQSVENNLEAQIKETISANAQFATGKTWNDTYTSWKSWSTADSFKSEAASKWIDSLVFYAQTTGVMLPKEKQEYIKNTLKAHAVAIYDAQVKHFAPKKEAQTKSAFQSRFNFKNFSKATLGLGFTALTGIVLYLNYKFGTKSYPLQKTIATINFKIPFYSRS